MPTVVEEVSPTQAISILAGGRVLQQRGETAKEYQRLYLRLRAAAERGALTRRKVGGTSRYLRAEVEALRDSYSRNGVTTGIVTTSANRRMAPLRAVAPPGYVSSVEAARIAGVDPTTPPHWGKRGWYGATKIGGRWFFDRKQIARKRKQFEPRVQVACDSCGAGMLVSQERLRRARVFHCGDCWAEQNRKRAAAEARAALAAAERDDRGKVKVLSEGAKRRWEEAGPEAREERGKLLAQAAAVALKTKSGSIRHANGVSRARGGNGISEEREREHERRARSRRAKGRAGRKASPAPPEHHREWAQCYADLHGYYERVATDPKESMPSHWWTCLEVAREDYAEHPERWSYDPDDCPRLAANRVSKALKALQIAHTGI